jgi:hypothetical protein
MLNGSGARRSLCPVTALSMIPRVVPRIERSAFVRSRWRTRPGTEVSRSL